DQCPPARKGRIEPRGPATTESRFGARPARLEQVRHASLAGPVPLHRVELVSTLQLGERTVLVAVLEKEHAEKLAGPSLGLGRFQTGDDADALPGKCHRAVDVATARGDPRPGTQLVGIGPRMPRESRRGDL